MNWCKGQEQYRALQQQSNLECNLVGFKEIGLMIEGLGPIMNGNRILQKSYNNGLVGCKNTKIEKLG